MTEANNGCLQSNSRRGQAVFAPLEVSQRPLVAGMNEKGWFTRLIGLHVLLSHQPANDMGNWLAESLLNAGSALAKDLQPG